MGWAARLNPIARDAAAGRVHRQQKPLSEQAQRDAARLGLPLAVWNYVMFGLETPAPSPKGEKRTGRDLTITRLPDDEAA
jgi:hypothetical protein